ncbi:type II toxin-antitoxin system mRNA interferase toxin, RelE/StbE family [Candidatus Gottesmanbacteria bacterium]|nr:type II toxin-antitoxin system mRNA interferase toxin, RelE/StbE family [Candidatus Gottesmanbacteria bacterium]
MIFFTVHFNNSFKRRFKKTDKSIRNKFKERLQMFLENPHHPLLRNHELTGNFQGKRSINITGDWRAIYFEKEPGIVVFELIGTHSMLYK